MLMHVLLTTSSHKCVNLVGQHYNATAIDKLNTLCNRKHDVRSSLCALDLNSYTTCIHFPFLTSTMPGVHGITGVLLGYIGYPGITHDTPCEMHMIN